MSEDLKEIIAGLRGILCPEYLEDEEPDRPKASNLPEIQFTTAGAPMKTRGKRPNGPEGAIVHYSASRVLQFGYQDALGVIQFGADEGYCFASISQGGTIVLPSNHDWYSWGYHAGKSQLPDGCQEVSMRCVGFELCNPGILIEFENRLYPWYNDPQKPTFKQDGHSWAKTECRYSRGVMNIARGWYLPFTPEQEKSLINVLVWMAKRFEHFKIDWVLGHDEVSPGRKTDPGGALSMTMPAFREELKRRL